MRLRYVTDDTPGLRRVRHGKGFSYLNSRNRPIHNQRVLERINGLRIPPAWRDVWICPAPQGHLQATGLDARGRKQYRYHDQWTAAREADKYEHLIAFAHALPRIRRRVTHDLKNPALARNKVLATVVRLLETTLIRVGNDEYARDNHSYGLTTLRNRHVQVNGHRIDFRFMGKSGKSHEIELHDRRLAKIVRRCRALPGRDVFQYLEAGEIHDVTSQDVNEYLQAIGGSEFTAKDFRTWAGTILAVRALREFGECDSPTAAKRTVLKTIDGVAERLGNTRAVCRKSYIHPGVLDAYVAGTLLKSCKRKSRRPIRGLNQEEQTVLHLLETLRRRRATITA
jgi:DNA topoisomerase-1